MGALLAGSVFGAFVVIYFWETTMTMKLMGDYSIELQYTNGTAMSTYDWGLFSVGQAKSLNAVLAFVGDVPVNVTWDTNLNLTAWDLTVDWSNETHAYQWFSGDIWGPMPPGGLMPIRINLTETDAIVGVADSFYLRFNSGEP